MRAGGGPRGCAASAGTPPRPAARGRDRAGPPARKQRPRLDLEHREGRGLEIKRAGALPDPVQMGTR
eukprot:3908542-Pyramimonas_sp.AAC.1